MEMNGTKPAGMTSSETHPSHMVLYQVCVDREGEGPFDGIGVQHEDKAEALVRLKETQQSRPYAYLATVTYQRWNADMKPPEQAEGQDQVSTEKLERIAGLANLGLRMTEKLQAVASLLGRLKPSEEDDAGQIADDLVLALEGMEGQLQFLHELFDGIEVKTGYYDGAPLATNREQPSQPEPAMV